MNFLKKLSFVICIFANGSSSSKTIEFVEDGYLMPASREIIALTENASQLFGFDQAYEVTIPKKSGMQINSWNKFVSSGINPQTKNPILIINADWFKTLSQDQQIFLLGRNLLMLKNGILPISVKVVPYLFILLTICLILLVYWLLGKTQLTQQNKWIRVLVAYVLVFACNIAFLNTLQTKVIHYLATKQDIHIIQMTIEKTQNKEAAIKTLEAIDTIIKNDLKNGEQFWTPYASLFENLVNELKK